MRALLFAALLATAGCTCAPPCTPGQLSCACRSGAQCDDGTCTDGKCVAPPMVGLVVSDAAARGCEVLLAEAPGTTIAKATFNSGVQGVSLRQAPQLAVTFVAPADAPLPSGGVTLALTSGALSGVTVTKATCVDSKGARLPNATVSLR